MFSMPGTGEWIIIFIVALLLFGPKKLPELAKGIGKALNEFKSAQREFQDEIRRAEYAVKEEPRKLPMPARTPDPVPASAPAPAAVQPPAASGTESSTPDQAV
jgi:TatA/E family protein of Tat protein translocase